MIVSHSRIECFKNCPYQYKMRYLDGVKVLPDDKANNALVLGTALHTAIEKGFKAAEKEYYNSYPQITDEHITEMFKLEFLIPRIKELLPEGKFEQQIMTSDYIGFIDLLSKNDDGTYNIYDFKYSNNIDNYLKSSQLHLYKYFFEEMTGRKVKDLYFVFAPKIMIRPKKIKGVDRKEEIEEFRKRVKQELLKSEIKILKVEYEPNKVIEFAFDVKKLLEVKDYPKNETKLCDWCEYYDYCQKGEDYMLLPKNERRQINAIDRKKIWIYGAPFSGKTYLANKFPDPLMLNTDGNIKFVDAPYIAIKDEITVNGRMTTRKFAWEVFKDVIAELEKKQNDFKTIVVDLLEDTYEHCRAYIFDREGYSHETDGGYGKGWDLVKTEFLNVIKRLTNLEYENIILISHEDLSKDLTKKSGDKITAIKPNIRENIANKVAGMVDIVARTVADDNERTLNFKNNEVIFGGGRLSVNVHSIPLDYDELMEVYEEANAGLPHQEKTEELQNTTEIDGMKVDTETGEVVEEIEQPKRQRRSRK